MGGAFLLSRWGEGADFGDGGNSRRWRCAFLRADLAGNSRFPNRKFLPCPLVGAGALASRYARRRRAGRASCGLPLERAHTAVERNGLNDLPFFFARGGLTGFGRSHLSAERYDADLTDSNLWSVKSCCIARQQVEPGSARPPAAKGI